MTALCREPLATKIAVNVANLYPLKKKNPEKRCITNAFQDSGNTDYLFPLNRSRGLRCQVIEHTVDSLDLGGDAGGDLL